jgi:hypothetical protein
VTSGLQAVEGVAAVALALLAIPPTCVAAGGLICLWRDARDSSGKPDLFADLMGAAPTGAWLSRVGLRFLLGPAPRPGDLVAVRSRDEIEVTLDANRTLEGLPFMEEMAEYCGKVFRVHRRVDKIFDMRHKTGLRRLCQTVSLNGLRCSGMHHDGCQAECQLLWKDAWLRRVPAREAPAADTQPQIPSSGATHAPRDEDRTYFCQMTELWEASRPMSPFDWRQDLRPLLLGNLGIRAYLIAILTQIFNVVQRWRGGANYPFMPVGRSQGGTPVARADLRPGETVVVRSREEIAPTLSGGKNRGLWFDPEMLRFCGRSATVRRRVERIIHEASKRMVLMKTPCVTLDRVVATGEYIRLCPQHDYIFWREIWLARTRAESAAVAVSE